MNSESKEAEGGTPVTPENPMPFPEGAVKTRLGELTFENGYPSKPTVEKLFEEMDLQRVCQAYLWALPIVDFAEWQRAHEKVFGAADGDLVIYLSIQTRHPDGQRHHAVHHRLCRSGPDGAARDRHAGWGDRGGDKRLLATARD